MELWITGAGRHFCHLFTRRSRTNLASIALCSLGSLARRAVSSDRAITPEEVAEIKAYMQRHRETDAPFDLVVILWSEGNATAEERQAVARYAEAGVTWWVEDLSTERFSSLQDVRARLHKGPPGVGTNTRKVKEG